MEVLGSIGCIPMHPSFASSFNFSIFHRSHFRLVVLPYRREGACVCVGARVVTATLALGCQIDLKQSSCSTRLVVVGVMVMVVVKTGNTVVRHSTDSSSASTTTSTYYRTLPHPPLSYGLTYRYSLDPWWEIGSRGRLGISLPLMCRKTKKIKKTQQKKQSVLGVVKVSVTLLYYYSFVGYGIWRCTRVQQGLLPLLLALHCCSLDIYKR